MVSAVISAFLYLRIVATMYVAAEDGEEVDPLLAGSDTAVITRSTVKVWAASALAIGIAVFITMEVGLLPWTFTDLAADAVPVLIAG
jgi:NADH:ubiquinone oxidoreductase subunit 2 (subunit N)